MPKIDFTASEVKIMYTLVIQGTYGGALLEAAHDLKKKLEKEIDPKELKNKEENHEPAGLGKPRKIAN